MHFTTPTLPLLLSLLPALANANPQDYGSNSSPSSSTSSSAAAQPTSTDPNTHIIQVGKSGLTFTPSSLNATAGQTLEFHFYPQSHSVAQSSFDAPCVPLGGNATSSGFFSGAVPTTDSTNGATNVFKVKLNDTKPIWFYCATAKHCESGMVGVINAPADTSKSLEAFAAAAKNVNSTVVPATVQGGVLGPVKSEGGRLGAGWVSVFVMAGAMGLAGCLY